MSYQVESNDNVQLLTGKGLEVLFARGTTAVIAIFHNGNLVCWGGQDAAFINTSTLTPHTARLMEEAAVCFTKEAA